MEFFVYITIVFEVDKIVLFHINNKISMYILISGMYECLGFLWHLMLNCKLEFSMYAYFGVGNMIKVYIC